MPQTQHTTPYYSETHQTVFRKQLGKKIRSLRLEYGLSQADLAKHLGVTFQQLQKYENGQNRINPYRLSLIMKLFDVRPCYFFMHNYSTFLIFNP